MKLRKVNLHNQKSLEAPEVQTYTWVLFLVNISIIVNNLDGDKNFTLTNTTSHNETV